MYEGSGGIEMVEGYDEEARAIGWFAPELAFGLTYEYTKPGQSILDVGIGTGLSSAPFRLAGLRVFGMDVSEDMLDACREKGVLHLIEHDLDRTPWPYESGSIDHAVCLGVMNFFADLSPVFGEVSRIIRPGGVFVFAVGDRSAAEDADTVVGPEHTHTGEPVIMYRHSREQVMSWFDQCGLQILKDIGFTAWMNRERSRSIPSWLYAARKRCPASEEPLELDQGEPET